MVALTFRWCRGWEPKGAPHSSVFETFYRSRIFKNIFFSISLRYQITCRHAKNLIFCIEPKQRIVCTIPIHDIECLPNEYLPFCRSCLLCHPTLNDKSLLAKKDRDTRSSFTGPPNRLTYRESAVDLSKEITPKSSWRERCISSGCLKAAFGLSSMYRALWSPPYYVLAGLKISPLFIGLPTSDHSQKHVSLQPRCPIT